MKMRSIYSLTVRLDLASLTYVHDSTFTIHAPSDARRLPWHFMPRNYSSFTRNCSSFMRIIAEYILSLHKRVKLWRQWCFFESISLATHQVSDRVSTRSVTSSDD